MNRLKQGCVGSSKLTRIGVVNVQQVILLFFFGAAGYRRERRWQLRQGRSRSEDREESLTLVRYKLFSAPTKLVWNVQNSPRVWGPQAGVLYFVTTPLVCGPLVGCGSATSLLPTPPTHMSLSGHATSPDRLDSPFGLDMEKENLLSPYSARDSLSSDELIGSRSLPRNSSRRQRWISLTVCICICVINFALISSVAE